MPKVYLRMLVSSPHELPFVWMNALEAAQHVDEVLVCEADWTHTGEPRQLIYDNLLSSLDSRAGSGVRYIPMEVGDEVVRFAESSDDLHGNEQIIRNKFTAYVDLNPRDIVFSVDADEIIFRQYYPELIRCLSYPPLAPSILSLKMYQFAYKLNYLWAGKSWRGPVACRASSFLGDPHAQWRYRGWPWPRSVGAHFSWVMSPEEMAAKIMRYSHRTELADIADPVLLSKAVEEKKYVFDPTVDFKVEELRGFSKSCQPRALMEIDAIYPDLFSSVWSPTGLT